MNATRNLAPSPVISAVLTAAAMAWLGLPGVSQDRGSAGRAPDAQAVSAPAPADPASADPASADPASADPAPGAAGEKRRGDRGGDAADRGGGEVPRFDGYDRERWDSLSDEEKERLRAALRDVWTDPQVISAREEVQQASEAYRTAVREAMGRLDPSAVPLLQEMQQEGEGRSRERLGSGPPGPSGAPSVRGRGGNRPPDFSPAGPPGFLARFPPEEQERFRSAEAEAQQSERVEAARSRLGELREQDDSMRKQRFEAHLDLRRALFEAILSEDPGLKEMVETLQRQVAPLWNQRGPRDSERRSPSRRGGEGDAGEGDAGSGGAGGPPE